MMLALSHSRWYMWGQQREVFPGLDSGPNGSEGHYFYALEKRPSVDPTYTTQGAQSEFEQQKAIFTINNNQSFLIGWIY